MWLELNTLAQGITQPWLIAGDFSALLTPQDRITGANVSLNEVKDFADCVKDIGVTELQWQGHYYSWTNKQYVTDRISSRIDRVLGIMNGWRNGDMLLLSMGIQQIEKASYELSRIQEELYDEATIDLVEQEKEIMMKLEKWSMIEESALRQKSRTRWIQLGDTNNKYCSAIIKERTKKK
ncbi:hypothetical protein KY285_007794 [Solanum tuberosum]|nr:hypothetical protein KY285_007794 [Solanum tuberosum]